MDGGASAYQYYRDQFDDINGRLIRLNKRSSQHDNTSERTMLLRRRAEIIHAAREQGIIFEEELFAVGGHFAPVSRAGRRVCDDQLARKQLRLRQIAIGKYTPEYRRYLEQVPKGRRTRAQPRTPDPEAQVSKRQFDKDMSAWRRLIHRMVRGAA